MASGGSSGRDQRFSRLWRDPKANSRAVNRAWSEADHEGTISRIPIAQTGIEQDVFFPDLLDFLIWEDYGLTNDEIEGYFKTLTPAQADLCIEHLRRQMGNLRRDDLGHQGEEALTILGQTVADQDRYDQFEGLAGEMGSRHWHRIFRLADRAVKKRKKPLACRIFEAALTEGSHLGFLIKKYEQLKAGRWNPDPRK